MIITIDVPDYISDDALAFAIRELYRKRNDGLESITAHNEKNCAEVADLLNAILEARRVKL